MFLSVPVAICVPFSRNAILFPPLLLYLFGSKADLLTAPIVLIIVLKTTSFSIIFPGGAWAGYFICVLSILSLEAKEYMSENCDL